MTKVRPPLTFENALTKVAAAVGWEKVAEICGQAERTVRNWSEPDTTASITLEAALKLDCAFHAAGGEGAPPFHLCYATRLDLERLAACPGREELLASIGTAAKESGEALAAALAASKPGAGRAAFAIAEKEFEETIAAFQTGFAALRARRKVVIELAGEPDEQAAGVGGAPALTA